MRLRFGMRTLLVATTLCAIFFAVVERRAQQQRGLKQAVSMVSGNISLVPISQWQPHFFTRLFGEDRTMTVDAIRVTGYQAPNLQLSSDARPFALVSTDLMRQLIVHPGMKSVRELETVGTSVTPELVTALVRLENLERLQLTSSMLVQSDMSALRLALPNCEIDGSSMANTVHWLRVKYPEELIPDVAVFSRARDGDQQAISELMALLNQGYLTEVIPKVLVAAGVKMSDTNRDKVTVAP